MGYPGPDISEGFDEQEGRQSDLKRHPPRNNYRLTKALPSLLCLTILKGQNLVSVFSL